MRIQVSGVRNLAEQELDFDTGVNLFVGANAQGKSSVLEAIYLLGTSRSYRTSRLSEVIAFGAAAARISGEGERPGERLEVFVSRKERSFRKHGKPVAPTEFIGTMDVVALSNDFVHAFRRQPAERRRFLDRMALATYPSHLDALREHRRVSAHRAQLAAAGVQGGERRAWDERAASVALPVARRRCEMAGALEGHLQDASRRIFPEGEGLKVRLVSRPAFDPGAEEAYRTELAGLFAAQEPAGRRETPAGPMRDDLSLVVQGRDLLRFGSAGQVRSLLTSAVLAEMSRLREIKGRFPVLVLDDMDADLDEGRYGALLGALGGGAQVFAATSKGRLVPGSTEPGRRFTVREGVVAAA